MTRTWFAMLALGCTPKAPAPAAESAAPNAAKPPAPAAASASSSAQRSPYPVASAPAPLPAVDSAANEGGADESSDSDRPATICEKQPAHKIMVDALYAHEDFRPAACGDEPCTKEAFVAALVFNAKVLREKPLLTGCFVEPEHQGTTRITGVFVLQTESKPELQFVFMGLGIGPDPKFMGPGIKDLVAGEREYGPDRWLTLRYRWNGKGYQLKSKEVHAPQ